MRALAPSAVVVDAFPLGILGELADPRVLPEVPLYHVARLLKWNAYRDAFAGTPRRYEETLAVEPLTPRHEDFLQMHSGAFRCTALPLEIQSAGKKPFGNRPAWLVVHCGPAPEVRTLLEYAALQAGKENVAPQYVVVSPRALELPAGVTRLAHPRAWELFPHAERIVTACGFNSMLETAPWRGKHLFLPLERRFDDQHLRAARARC